MIIFDQLRRGDPQLRGVTLMVLGGLGVLLAGLWWVQIVSARDYQESLETQSFRTVRIPAVRGKVLDRNGTVLAENRPTYRVSLYFEELRRLFDKAGEQAINQARAKLKQQAAEKERALGRKLSKVERKEFVLQNNQRLQLKQAARYEVASNVVTLVGMRIHQSLWLNPTNFEKHYQTRLALPFPLVANLDSTNIARFEEQSTTPLGVDLEIQSTRIYPLETTAGHLLGMLKHDDSSVEGEEAFFSYRLPDFRGALGIEFGFDRELRGVAGAKSVQVNNLGYRASENVWSSAEPGSNVVLTIDAYIQQAAERALREAPVPYIGPVKGAAVVMDVHTGDVLALASSPTVNPNFAVQGYPPGELERRNDPRLRPEFNRATQGNYYPGSVFKTVVGLAALEAGLDPRTRFYFAENPKDQGRAYIIVRGRPVKDTAPPGDYDFRRGIIRSCNGYFITNGIRVGPERIVRLAQRAHLGERLGLNLNQETGGALPSLKRITSGWVDGNTANLCIGQETVMVTPLQIAVLISAIANGGTVLRPRLVDRIEPPDGTFAQEPIVFPKAQVRDQLGVSQRSLGILNDAMVAETEDAEGTGKPAREAVRADYPDLRICGKTGTAQIKNVEGQKTGQTTWFASFAPYGNPRWAVVVMVEDGKSGGEACSPVAGKIYHAIMDRERMGIGVKPTVANVQ
jgi:penicillin-binding protein 2